MKVNVAKDWAKVIVHTMNPVHQRGPIFYASWPSGPETPQRPERNGDEAKHRLISILWDHLMAIDRRLWTFHRSFRGAAFPIQLVRDPLGKPQLLLGAHRGPAISFSEGGGRVWAALCGDESDMGIDVAAAVEFQGAYPVARVFHAQEVQHVLHLAGGDLAKASALLWSVKEAVVKALGCAFHLVDPLQIHVCPFIRGDDGACHGGYTFPVRLSGKALARFPVGADLSLCARSVSRAKMWLSIAVLNRHVE